MRTHVTETNFVIPAKLKDRWIFVSQTVLMQIRRKGRKTIEFQTSYYKIVDPLDQSIGLDWMQETLEHIRWLCKNG